MLLVIVESEKGGLGHLDLFEHLSAQFFSGLQLITIFLSSVVKTCFLFIVNVLFELCNLIHQLFFLITELLHLGLFLQKTVHLVFEQLDLVFEALTFGSPVHIVLIFLAFSLVLQCCDRDFETACFELCVVTVLKVAGLL